MIADNDVTGAAFVAAAAEMRAGHAKRPAQGRQQRELGIGIDIGLDAIEAKSDARHRNWALLLRLVGELFDDGSPFNDIAAQIFVEFLRGH